MAGADAMRERIAAHPWPRGGVEVVRAIRGYTLYSTAGAPASRSRACGRPARATTSRFCGGAVMAGARPAPSDQSSCRSIRHSTSSPLKASSGSAHEAHSAMKRAKSNLVIAD
jgi:hypothetical protein